MKKTIIAMAMAVCAAWPVAAQQNPTYETRTVNIPSEKNLGVHQTDFAAQEQGFFCAGEASYGYSLTHHRSGIQYGEVDVTMGYRFGDMLRVGAGIGARNYFEAKGRAMSHDWGMPLFVHARGNFMGNGYRNVVPFWSFDLGATMPDGVMVRPTVGIRVGQPRSAFVASIGYMGQQIREHKTIQTVNHPFVSFITLKIGYEF